MRGGFGGLGSGANESPRYSPLPLAEQPKGHKVWKVLRKISHAIPIDHIDLTSYVHKATHQNHWKYVSIILFGIFVGAIEFTPDSRVRRTAIQLKQQQQFTRQVSN